MALLLALCVLVLPDAPTTLGRWRRRASFLARSSSSSRQGSGSEVNARYDTQVRERFLERTNTNIFLLMVPVGSTAREKLAQIRADEPIRSHASSSLTPSGTTSPARPRRRPGTRAFPAGDATPTTRNYSKDASYADSALNLTAARAISQGAGTTVAVLDTGAQLDHPQLRRDSRAFRATIRRR